MRQAVVAEGLEWFIRIAQAWHKIARARSSPRSSHGLSRGKIGERLPKGLAA